MAEAVRADALALRVARERVTLLRRDCAKLILALEEAEDAPQAAEPLRSRYSAILKDLPRLPVLADLEAVSELLTALAADVSKLLLAHQEILETIGSLDQDVRHNQSSKPDALGSEPAFGLGQKEAAARGEGRAVQAENTATRSTYPLGLVSMPVQTSAPSPERGSARGANWQRQPTWRGQRSVSARTRGARLAR